jgi:hypothetical protein
MAKAKDELKQLYGRVEDVWTLSEELERKGSVYHDVAHAVSEIANYLGGEGVSLQIASQSLQAAVDGESLFEIVAESRNK